MLIKCPECSKQISDAAPSCPHCGIEFASKAENSKIVTIQETSKRLKLHTLGAIFILLIGVVLLVFQVQANQATDNPEVSPLPFLVIACGLGWFLVTRLRIWWHHK